MDNKKVADHFDWEASNYDFFTYIFPKYGETIDNLFKNIPKGKVAIDYGTGTGILSFFLAKAGYEKVLAVDISPEMIKELDVLVKKKNLDNIIEGVVEEITKFESDIKADVITAGYVIHHLSSEEKNQIFFRARKNLKKGGTFIIGDYMIDDKKYKNFSERIGYAINRFGRTIVLFLEKDLFNHDEHPITIGEYIDLFRINGFKDIQYIKTRNVSDYVIWGVKK